MEEKKRQANFQRTKFYAYVKLGKKHKKLRKYRRATGRHNKIRQKWRGKTPMVQIGYKNRCATRGLINDKTPILVHNVNELSNVLKDNIIIIAKTGDRNKLEIAKEAVKRNMEIANLNAKKFIKQMERIQKLKNKSGENK